MISLKAEELVFTRRTATVVVATAGDDLSLAAVLPKACLLEYLEAVPRLVRAIIERHDGTMIDSPVPDSHAIWLSPDDGVNDGACSAVEELTTQFERLNRTAAAAEFPERPLAVGVAHGDCICAGSAGSIRHARGGSVDLAHELHRRAIENGMTVVAVEAFARTCTGLAFRPLGEGLYGADGAPSRG